MKKFLLVCVLASAVRQLAVENMAAEASPAEFARFAQVVQLVRQLGDAKQATRDEATKKLIEIGEPVRPQLKGIQRDSQDPEVKRRIDLILKKLDEVQLAKIDLQVIGLYEPPPGAFDFALLREVDHRALCAAIRLAAAKWEPSPGKQVWDRLAPDVRALVQDTKRLERLADMHDRESQQMVHALCGALNKIVDDPALYDARSFAGVELGRKLKELLDRRAMLQGLETRWLNRLLLAAAFPREIMIDPEKVAAELVTVEVRATKKPMVLALCSSHAVRWEIKVAPGVQLTRVIISGYERQEVTPVNAPVEDYSRGSPLENGTESYFYAYSKGSRTDPDELEQALAYNNMAVRLKQLTGKNIDSFQGQNTYDGRPFVVTDPIKSAPLPKDAEVHVVAVHEAGYIEIPHAWNWLGLIKQIRDAGQRPDRTPARRIWDRLPERLRRLVRDEEWIKQASSTLRPEDQQFMRTLCDGVLTVVRHPEFYEPAYFEKFAASEEIRPFLPKLPKLTPPERESFSSLLLIASFPDHFKSSFRDSYECGTVKVRVPVTEKPIILVLSAYNSIRWQVEAAPGARLLQVIAGGYHAQEVSGVSVPIHYRTVEYPDRDEDRSVAIRLRHDRTGDEEQAQKRAEQQLREMTGFKDITGYQSMYHWDGKPIVVGTK